MFSLGSAHQYYLYRGRTDMRKGFDALCGLVNDQLGRDPRGGEVFIFVNRRRDHVKLLHWESGGFVLYYKRLERGTLELPPETLDQGRISWTMLVMMIEGIELRGIKTRARYHPPKRG